MVSTKYKSQKRTEAVVYDLSLDSDTKNSYTEMVADWALQIIIILDQRIS